MRRPSSAANRFIYSVPVELTAPEIASVNRLINENRGNSQRKNVERALHHIFETGKYGGGQRLATAKCGAYLGLGTG